MLDQNPIKVVRHGPVYCASVLVSVRPGSPYRAAFMSGYAIARGFGLSAESAARRCADKRRKILAGDEEVYRSRKSRTSYFDV
jgi:hypothetical protein